MKTKVIEEDKNYMELVIEDIDVSIANTLRRAMISEVPTLAIEDVTIIENTSSLYDEMIAHRLGLIPIKTDLKLFDFREKCKCKGNGCASCTLKLSFEAEGKDRATVVYSNDIKSEDSKLKPVEGIPIIKLGKGQKLSFEADAILGTAKIHAKWQPAIVGYKYYPEIEVSDRCQDCEECESICPVNILKISRGKMTVTDEKKCTLCNSCVENCEKGIIKVKGNEKKFIFKIESIGALPPKEIFKEACQILEKKTEELEELL